MRLSDFSYDLPPELIARYPLQERSASRLLVLEKNTGRILHRQFVDIVDFLKPGDLLVCNDTKVIHARLFGKKATGGQVEILVERILDAKRFIAHVRASKAPKPGSQIFLANTIADVLQRHDNLFELQTHEPILSVIESDGEIPIPVYFNRKPEALDEERYQTIFAKYDGSVAAPTAGLHFDETLFKKIREKNIEIAYLTLHVGSGTFALVRTDNIQDHKMHSEYIEVSDALCEKIRATKARGGRVIAVGTTSARSLETAAKSGEIQSFRGETDIFIYPGFEFKCVDALITNFHVPHSTLLMLVSAFAGREQVMRAYEEAVRERYRFFSYGDAMFLV